MFLYFHRYNIQIRKKTRLRLYSLSPLKVLLVRRMGLEPTHLAALTPEASASTNSAIFASHSHLMVIPMRIELMTVSFGN